MAMTKGEFPYDINNLLGGAARVVIREYDPAVPAVPADPKDIFLQTGGYEPVAPFRNLGATKEAFQYGRSIDVGGWQIQNVAGNVVEEITNVGRTVRVSMAEMGPDGLALIEQQPQVEDIAEAVGMSAYKKLGFGAITDLQRYTVAFVAKRSMASGIVKEGASDDAPKRGRFVVGVGYNVSVSADNVEMQLDRGNLAAAQVTFTFFPEPSIADPKKAYGGWFFEEAGTIAEA